MNTHQHTMSTNDPLPHLRGFARLWFFIRKTFEYFKRYSGNPKYLYLYLTKSLSSTYKENVHFISDSELLVMSKTKSTIRLQDGEMGLLLGGRGIYFQSFNSILREKLLNSVSNYTDKSPYLIGLPPFITLPNKILASHNFKYLWLPSKILYKLMFNRQANYFNGCYFYQDNTVVPFLNLTSEQKDVIIVTNENNARITKEKGADFFPNANSITFILAPAQNAFDNYDTIIKNIRSESRGKNPIIYMAFGPAGKAMIYDLSTTDGLVAHDIGHGLLFALNGESKEYMIRWDIFGKIFTNQSITPQA